MDDRLLREIQKSNPWWFGRADILPEYRRPVFKYILRYIKAKQIIAIIGLRRIGKTILMKQLVQDLLGEVNPKNILFFAFEERWGKSDALEDILYHFLENVAGKKRKFIFLDEIQKVKDWEETLKRFYDRYPDVKFIVSGSASLRISKSVESLAGRIFDVHMAPLSFLEYLEMTGKAPKAGSAALEYDKYRAIYEGNLHRKEELVALFGEYLFKGGFPELSQETDDEFVRKYIMNSVIERILLKDIPEEFAVKNVQALRGIIEYAARETSGILVVENLATILGINKETVGNYVEYLKRAFLLHVLYNYTASIAKQLRTSKKLHIALPSIAIALESYGKDVILHPEIMGKYVESLVAVFLAHEYDRIFFWRTPQKDEVDIVVKGRHLTPIEVKFKNQIVNSDLKSLIKFCSKFGAKRAIAVTKDTLETRRINGINVELVPAWLFMLGL